MVFRKGLKSLTISTRVFYEYVGSFGKAVVKLAQFFDPSNTASVRPHLRSKFKIDEGGVFSLLYQRRLLL